MLGAIYEDYLQGYTHWGYGDLDNIYGELSELVALQNGCDFDLICTDKELCANGPLSIIKNSEKMVNMYKRISNIWEIAQSPTVNMIDEGAFRAVIEEGVASGTITQYVKYSSCTPFRIGAWIWYRGKLLTSHPGGAYTSTMGEEVTRIPRI